MSTFEFLGLFWHICVRIKLARLQEYPCSTRGARQCAPTAFPVKPTRKRTTINMRLKTLFLLVIISGGLCICAIAEPVGGKKPAPPPRDKIIQFITMGSPFLLLVALSLKYFKNKRLAGGKDNNHNMHRKQVEEVVNLKKIYKSYYNVLYPDGVPDDKLTIECPSCRNVYSLYVPRCNNCNESICLDSTIKLYEEKIKTLESLINARRSDSSA